MNIASQRLIASVGLGGLLWCNLLTAQPARSEAPQAAIVPRPAALVPAPGEFVVGTATVIFAGNRPEARPIATMLAEHIAHATGLTIAVRDGARVGVDTGYIELAVNGGDSAAGEEGYGLTVTPAGVMVHAYRPAGLFRGVQTFRQLLPSRSGDSGSADGKGLTSVKLPCLSITDVPRFPHRGMLLDCGRHFMSKDFIKRYIDLLAFHKMNVLHWHLTEDQGWRIEIKKYPRLTEVGAWRGEGAERYGGFYTQEDVKEIVAYAASRFITVIPEIEMPGHSLAALAAYPEFSCTGGPFPVGTKWGVFDDVYCAGNDRTFEFLLDVLTEVMELFPSEFIHIGGDECPKTRWKACPKCQERIKAEGLANEHELQSYFIRRMEKFLNGRGRRLIGWDEILEGGLAPNATVQSWRGMEGAIAAATSGHDIIASPTSHCYLDYAQGRNPGEPTNMGYLPLAKVYSFEPTPPQLTAEQARHVLGVECNMWTEHAPQSLVDRQVFPRLCAVAEVGWSPKELRDWGDFSMRMQEHYKRLDALGVTYYIPPPSPTSMEFSFVDTVDVAFAAPFRGGEIRYTLDGSDPSALSAVHKEPVRLTTSTVMKARTFLANGRESGSAELKYKKLIVHEPVAAANPESGLAYSYYEGSIGRMADIDRMTPLHAGTAAAFDLGVRRREEEYALRFSGFLDIEREGAYTFYLTSDDGSRLWIGSDLVVDNDGRHQALEASGKALLNAGKHPLVVEFFQSIGPQSLRVEYEGPGSSRGPIPPAVLSHETKW